MESTLAALFCSATLALAACASSSDRSSLASGAEAKTGLADSTTSAAAASTGGHEMGSNMRSSK